MTSLSSRDPAPDIAARGAAYANGGDPARDLDALYDRLEAGDIKPAGIDPFTVPAGLGADGLPVGVTLVGPAFADGRLAAIGDDLHRAFPGATMGASALPLPSRRVAAVAPAHESPAEEIDVAVVGVHLSGEPLNWQLKERGGTLLASMRTGTGDSLRWLAHLSRLPGEGGLTGLAEVLQHLALQHATLQPSPCNTSP